VQYTLEQYHYEQRAATPDRVLDAIHNPPCMVCGGYGFVETTESHYSESQEQWYPDYVEVPCDACGGSGHQMDAWERHDGSRTHPHRQGRNP